MTLREFHKAYYGTDAPLWWAVISAVFGPAPYRVTFDALRGKWPYPNPYLDALRKRDTTSSD